MKCLAVLLFLGSFLAVKSLKVEKYELNLIADGAKPWPIRAELYLTVNPNKNDRIIELNKKGTNIESVSCQVDAKQCQYKNGTMKDEIILPDMLTNKIVVKLTYKINKTKCLDLWTSRDKTYTILAGNLRFNPSEVILHQDERVIPVVKVNNEPSAVWGKDFLSNVNFVGGDVMIKTAENYQIFAPKNGFDNAVKIVSDFLGGLFGDIITRGENIRFIMIPFNIELSYSENISRMAAVLETENVEKFAKSYLFFTLKTSLNVIRYPVAKGNWWTTALAYYFSYYGPEKYNRDVKYNWMERFFLDFIQNVNLEEGALKTFHLLTDNYRFPSAKGASIVHSLRLICGDKNFISGVKKSLETDPNNKVLVDNFGHCFQEKDHLLSFCHKSVFQPGYPVLHAVKKDNEYALVQEQFLWSGAKTYKTWPLPLAVGSTNNGISWFASHEGKILANFSGIRTINPDYAGHFRVNYPKEIWNKAIESKMEKTSDPFNPFMRAQMINDAFSFAKSTFDFERDVPDYATALKLASYLGKEKDYLPLKAAFNAFESLESLLGEKLNTRFTAYLGPIVQELYNRFPLNMTAKTPKEESLMKEVGFLACKLEIESCITHAKEKMDEFNKKYANSLTDPGTDVLNFEVPLCVDIRNGNEETWSKLFKRSQEIGRDVVHPCPEWFMLTNALGCTKIEQNILLLLNEISKYNYGENDKHLVSSILRGNGENVNAVLKFLNATGDSDPMFLNIVVDLVSSKMNMDNLHLFKELEGKLFDESRLSERMRNLEEWNEKKIGSLRDELPSGEGKAAPIALAVIFSAMLPIINSAFKN